MKINGLALLGILISVSVFAEPGTYEGGGRGRQFGESEGTYTAKLTLTEISPKSVYQVDESWTDDKGKTGTSSLTFHFNSDGTFKVKRKDVEVGCGYSFDDAEGHWMDYRIQTEHGPMHINQYYSKTEKALHRLGDGILNGKVMFWTDNLIKK